MPVVTVNRVINGVNPLAGGLEHWSHAGTITSFYGETMLDSWRAYISQDVDFTNAHTLNMQIGPPTYYPNNWILFYLYVGDTVVATGNEGAYQGSPWQQIMIDLETYDFTGVHTLKVEKYAVGNNGGFSPIVRNIEVLVTDDVHASFSMSHDIVHAGRPVTFTDESFGATSYMWYFGDGTTSTEPSPVKTYGSPGVYYPMLRLNGETDPGCVDSHQLTVMQKVTPIYIKGGTSDNWSVASVDYGEFGFDKTLGVLKIGDVDNTDFESALQLNKRKLNIKTSDGSIEEVIL
jgi:hypothetical protein